MVYRTGTILYRQQRRNCLSLDGCGLFKTSVDESLPDIPFTLEPVGRTVQTGKWRLPSRMMDRGWDVVRVRCAGGMSPRQNCGSDGNTWSEALKSPAAELAPLPLRL
eukprot:1195313-Prorocentrum_minimum.AAC.8